MRLSNIEIKDVYNGIHSNMLDRNSKLLVLNLEEGEPIIILLGVGRRESAVFESMVTRVPNRYLYQAHIAITYDFLLRNFSIVKHRFGADGTRFNSINQINKVLLEQFIDMGFGMYDSLRIISEFCRCYAMTTGETIFFSRQLPYGGTMYDLRVSGENTTDATRYFGHGIDTIKPIKINIRHNFLG